MDLGYLKPTKLFYHPERISQLIKNEVVEPITVKLYLTEKCNLNCKYCVYKKRLSSKVMTESNADRILEKLKFFGVKGIVLTGGEPTMHPKFESIVTLASNVYGFDIGLITNGIIQRSIRHLTWARYSIDTVNQETYSRMKGMPDLNTVLDNIAAAIKEKRTERLKTTIGVQMVVTEDNYQEIYEFVNYFANTNVNYCQIRPVENTRYTPEQLEKIKEQLDLIDKKEYKMPIMTTRYKWDEIENNYKKSYEGCPGAKLIGAIGTEGDYYICCTWMKEPTAKYGNILNDGRRVLDKRDDILAKFNYSKCPVGCQGSLVNKALINFQKVEHRNFI